MHIYIYISCTYILYIIIYIYGDIVNTWCAYDIFMTDVTVYYTCAYHHPILMDATIRNWTMKPPDQCVVLQATWKHFESVYQSKHLSRNIQEWTTASCQSIQEPQEIAFSWDNNSLLDIGNWYCSPGNHEPEETTSPMESFQPANTSPSPWVVKVGIPQESVIPPVPKLGNSAKCNMFYDILIVTLNY